MTPRRGDREVCVMLTLGLMEGVLSATVGILFLVGAANENAPLHKIFGPLVAVTLGGAAYLAHDVGAMHSPSNVVGLGFFATVAFFVPLVIMRAAWKGMRSTEVAPTERRVAITHEAATESPVVPRKAA